MSRVELDQAWSGWLQAQQKALDLINNANRLSPLDVVEGYRYVTRLSALALTIYVECDDPLWPRFELQLDPHARKFACDSPDTIYWRAPVTATDCYRLTGDVGSSPYTALAIQSDLYTGRTGRKGTLAQYSLEGKFDITLGGPQTGANWIPLPEDASDILIRQTVREQSERESARVHIERISGEPGVRPPLTEAQWIEGLRKASLFLPGCIAMFLAMANHWGANVNGFRYQPSQRNKRDAEGGDPHLDYFQGTWRLEPGEALLIDLTPPPEFRLWSFVACNGWSESLDYSGGSPVAINNSRAEVRADGSVRLILCDEDPQQPNWIGTTGHREGLMLLRWLFASEPPQHPVTQVVRVEELRSGLGYSPVKLDLQSLCEEAQRRTGLSDFGSREFEAPLETYLRAIDTEAHPTPIGRWLARVDVLNLLETRLCVRDLERTTPEIFAQPVVEPVFVTGAPRSGTSLLHRLLGEDPANRIPLIWEALKPCPPPSRDTYDSDPRIAQIDRLMRQWVSLSPGYQAIHELGARVPSECGMLMNGSGASDQLAIAFRTPSYEPLVFGPQADLRPAYLWHRKVLQVLQWRMPGRWVLKAPLHLQHLETLLEVYPDARFVQTHRDPLKVLPSVASLLQAQLRMRSDHLDVTALRLGLTGEGLAYGLDRATALRDAGRINESRIVDVRYFELVRDPVGVVRAVYDRFGWPFTADVERRVREATASHPKDAHGLHQYSIDELPIDRHAERQRFARYQARYGVPSEN